MVSKISDKWLMTTHPEKYKIEYEITSVWKIVSKN
jgi:hypothetical protein